MTEGYIMKSKLLASLSAAVIGAAISLPNPAIAFHGGGGFGGMHGGFGGGGMHFGGGGFAGTGMHFGGAPAGSFHGMVTGRSAFVPGAGRFGGGSLGGQRFAGNRFNNFRVNNFAFRHRFFSRHHQFRDFAFLGAPFAVAWNWPYDYGYGGCWQQVWSGYGWQWINVCTGYNYGYGY